MSHRRNEGFALIAALWLLVALSAAGLELSLRARERRLIAANVLEGAAARAAAEAGLAHVRSRFGRQLHRAERLQNGSAAGMIDPWAEPQGLFPDTIVLEGARYGVSVRDAGAALNLNRATEEELRRFLRALRVDFGRADRIAQQVMDWRDADDFHRARGAEREDYLERGSPVLPRNGPFQDLSELLYVKDMTSEVWGRARPHLTLAGTGQVNLNAASRPVLLALPGMGEEAVRILLRSRRSWRPVRSLQELTKEVSPRAAEALQTALPELLQRTTFETREVEVVSRGWAPGSPVRATARGLLVRSGSAVYLVSRSIE